MGEVDLFSEDKLAAIAKCISPTMKGWHRLVIICALQGLSNKEVAAAVGCNAATVGAILRRDDVREEIGRLNAIRGMAVVDKTARLRERYEEVMQDVLEIQFGLAKEADEESVRATAARDILAGARAVLGLDKQTGGARTPVLEIRTTVVNAIQSAEGAEGRVEVKESVAVCENEAL